MENYETIELFAGAGGMALGFEKAGFKPLLLVEKDKDAINTLRNNRPNWPVWYGDVKEVSFEGFKGLISVVVGGFPCQAFSHVGKRLGFEDTRGTLFYEFARCIKETRPKIFMGENVYGLLTHNKGDTFRVIKNVLENLGYKVEYRILDSANYGVPQRRKRIIIVGTDLDLKKSFLWPKANDRILPLRTALLGCPPSAGVKYSQAKEKIMDMVPPGGNWKNLPNEIAKSYMGKAYYGEGGRTTYAKRLSWEEPSLTILCTPAQKQTERCHPDETRPLTIRECARIQTFPDDWTFYGSISSQYKQIGNAVPVEFSYRLAMAIKETLTNESVLEEDTLFGEL